MRFILAIVGAMCAMPASAQQPTPCDLLAGHVEDPDRVGPGAADVADKKAAITACEKDLAADPNNRRLKYQLARVLFYDGQTPRAMTYLQAAADDGSQQAQFVLGYITDEALQGVVRDVCKVEDLWVKSARQGRFAAQVSYPRHVMDGKFASCKIQANNAEIAEFLDKATKGAGLFGYYAEILAAQMTKDFAAYRAAKK